MNQPIRTLMDAIDTIQSIDGYRGVSQKEFEIIRQIGHPLPSSDLMPFDNEIIEYSLGDDYSQMSDQEIESWIQSICPWYDGSLNSVKNGLNFTTDESNAEGYGEIILALHCDCPAVEFSDVHAFAKDANLVKVVKWRLSEEWDEWYDL